MANKKKWKPSKKQIALDVIEDIVRSTMALGDVLREAKDPRVKKFCFDASDFGCKMSAFVMLRSPGRSDFSLLAALVTSLAGLMDVTGNYSKRNLAWMRDQYRQFLESVKDFVAPEELTRLRREFDEIDGDGVEMQYSLLNSIVFAFGFIKKGNEGVVDKGSYCPHCYANQLKQEIFQKVDELFGTRIQCLRAANGIEAVANHPNTPESKRSVWMERAQYIREFADVNAEDVDNYDEVAMDVSADYACCLVEGAGFVRSGLFTARDFAVTGGFDEAEISSLSESKGVLDYLVAVGRA